METQNLNQLLSFLFCLLNQELRPGEFNYSFEDHIFVLKGRSLKAAYLEHLFIWTAQKRAQIVPTSNFKHNLECRPRSHVAWLAGLATGQLCDPGPVL